MGARLLLRIHCNGQRARIAPMGRSYAPGRQATVAM